MYHIKCYTQNGIFNLFLISNLCCTNYNKLFFYKRNTHSICRTSLELVSSLMDILITFAQSKTNFAKPSKLASRHVVLSKPKATSRLEWLVVKLCWT